MYSRAQALLRGQAPSRTCWSQGAQGTIEYLVILAIVIVIGLAVVGFSTGIFSGSSVQVNSSSGNLSNKIGVGGISISESVVDPNGGALISLANNSGENFTLTKITPVDSKGNDGEESTFDNTITQGELKIFSLNSVNSVCPCAQGDTTKTCTFKLTLTTSTGLTKTLTTSIATQCVQNLVLTASQTSVTPTNYSYPSCWDEITIPHPICSLSDLNRMREHLDWDYILSNDINAYATRTWDNGAGFDPIARHIVFLSFSGSLEGNFRKIYNLYINRPSTEYVSLLGYSMAGKITHLGLVDVNIIGGTGVGGIATSQETGPILGCFVSGTITGSGWGGGIAGTTSNGASISNSYSTAAITISSGVTDRGGGLVGMNGGKVVNSYATAATTNFVDWTGGITANNYGDINNSFSTAAIYGKYSGYYAGSITGTNDVGPPLVNDYGYDVVGDSTHNCVGVGQPGDCKTIVDANGGISWFYYDTNEPLASWGTWTSAGGNKYSTTDGNWSICRGATLPWLTWENRTC